MATPAAILNILVNAQTGKASADLRRFNGELKATQGQAVRSTGAASSFGKVAKVGVAAGAAAAAYGLYKTVSAGASFEKQMDALGAVSGATRRQMVLLEKQALKLGESTQYTANEVAKAQTELVKGGLSLKQILGGGLKAALSLAAAGELDLAEAAGTTVNAMKLFGLGGKDAMQVADMLATAANKTTADVHDFALALKQGGSVSRLAGMDMNETVTVLEALAEAGIKSSDAGTSLKSFFINIGTPSKKAKTMMEELGLSIFKQNGELEKLPALAANLREAFGDLTKEEFLEQAGTIAGSDAIRTLYSLYEAGPQKLRALERANRQFGTAQQIAAEKTDNLTGDFEEFTGALETKYILAFKRIQPALRSGVQALTEFVRSSNEMSLGRVSGQVNRVVASLKTFWKESGATRSVVVEAFRVTRDVVRESVEAMIMTIRGWLQVIRGIVKVISGILTGDFRRVWDGVKDIFAGGVKATIGVFKGITAPARRIAATVGGAIADIFSAAWDKIVELFESRANRAIGFINAIIDVINLIPGVPDIGKVGLIGDDEGGISKKRSRELARETNRSVGRYMGGPINKPMAIVGEEAPRHHEWVIATNPAYRKANLSYWARAGADLGVPGFATGGPIGKAVGAAAGLFGKGADYFIDKLPKPAIPEPFKGLGPYLIAQVGDWITSGFESEKFGGLVAPNIGGAGYSKAVAVGKWLQRLGYQVGEHPAFGGIQGSHDPDGYHPDGRAIDVNADGKAPSEAYWLDRIHPKLQRLNPAELLWRVAGHFGHLHAAFRKGGRFLREGGRWSGLVGSHWDNDELATLANLVGMANPGRMAQIAQGESGGNPSAVGHDPGGTEGLGLWQITTGFNDDLIRRYGGRSAMFNPLNNAKAAQEILERQGMGAWYAPPTGPLGRVDSRLAANMRRLVGGADVAGGLTEGEEKRRQAQARKKAHEAQLKKLRQAVGDAKTNPAKQSKLWQLVKFWGRVGMFDKGKRAHVLDMVSRAAGAVKVGDSVRILQDLAAYAGEHGEITGKDPDDWRSLIDAMNKAQERGRERREKTVAKQRDKRQRRRNKKLAKLEERAAMPELVAQIEQLRQATDQAEEIAGQYVTLEPENLTDEYVGTERSAYEKALVNMRDWRNTVVSGRDLATQRIHEFQEQIARIEAMAPQPIVGKLVRGKGKKKGRGALHSAQVLGKNTYAQEAWKIPGLRKGIETLSSLRDETLLGELQEVSPLALTGLLDSLPTSPEPGKFGGRVFDLQNTISELGLKTGPATKTDDSGRTAMLEELLRQANQRNLVFERQKPIIDRYMETSGFAGMFAKGGSIPMGKWGIVGEAGPEIVRGPVEVSSNRESASMTLGTAPNVRVQVFEGDPSATKVFVGEKEVEGIVERMKRRQGKQAKLRNPRSGRGVG